MKKNLALAMAAIMVAAISVGTVNAQDKSKNEVKKEQVAKHEKKGVKKGKHLAESKQASKSKDSSTPSK